MSINKICDEIALQSVIQRTASLLDAEDLAGWLALFDQAASYRMVAASSELGKQLTWWKSDVPTLQKTLNEVPRHVRDPARRLRVLGPALIQVSGDAATTECTFAVYRTLPSGETTLYLVGRYKDEFIRTGSGEWRYRLHEVQADTRVLDAFTHLPL